jgi:Peptidase M16 inactive domain
VSLLVRRSTTWTALTALLSERLQDHLRLELGLTYGVGATYWRLDRDWAHIIIGADAAPGQGQAVRDGLLKVLDQFAHEGPATADLERYVTLSERYRYDPDAIQGLLDTHASDELVGARTPSAEQISKELRALTPDSMARQFRPALEGMIALVPPGLGLDATRARAYQVGAKVEPIRGTDYSPQTPGSDETITVGKEGVSRRVGNHVVTIRFEDCVLVALEGEFAVTLISSNGESIWFQYRGDKAKKQILGAIEAGVPGNRTLRVSQEVQERLERVMALADTKLGDRKGWALTVLPRVLFEGEKTLNLARANWASESGLLVVTDARVLLIDEAGDRLLVEVPREQIVGADAGRGLRKGHVMIDDGQTQHRFTSVAPGSRAAEIRDELSG